MSPNNLTCRELVELVTAYLEAALPPAEHMRFEAHLAICAGCRNYVEQLRRTIRVTGTLTEESIPAHIQDHLLELFRGWKRQPPER
jgi:anti-sigma factor RsiW